MQVLKSKVLGQRVRVEELLGILKEATRLTHNALQRREASMIINNGFLCVVRI